MKITSIAQNKPNRVTIGRLHHRGEDQEFALRHLSAKKMDEIKRLYPDPRPPRYADNEGRKHSDATDPDFVEAYGLNAQLRAVAMVCKMLGPEFFGSTDPQAQMDALTDEYDMDEIVSLARQGREGSEVRDLDEAADDTLRPTA